MNPTPPTIDAPERNPERHALTHHKQMLDAQKGCVPCKLCGGSAVIEDAGTGAGYYISCSNRCSFRQSTGCMIGQVRLGGWAYNVMDWWNRLHTPLLAASSGEREKALEEAAREVEKVAATYLPGGPVDIKGILRRVVTNIRALIPTPATVEEPKV